MKNLYRIRVREGSSIKFSKCFWSVFSAYYHSQGSNTRPTDLFNNFHAGWHLARNVSWKNWGFWILKIFQNSDFLLIWENDVVKGQWHKVTFITSQFSYYSRRYSEYDIQFQNIDDINCLILETSHNWNCIWYANRWNANDIKGSIKVRAASLDMFKKSLLILIAITESSSFDGRNITNTYSQGVLFKTSTRL